ncbi:MAG: cation-translocating P-type ATPase [Candidatus Roizmanbacteria bacterium]
MVEYTGISESQVEILLKEFGPNKISERKKHQLLYAFLDQFKSVLVLLLIGASILSLYLREMVDAFLILFIVFLNALFGLYQEWKASEAIASLKEISITKVRVIRDSKEIEIISTELVPGDVVYLEEGVKVPADGIILEGLNLEINESTLTGESLPVLKGKDDEVNMGTIVTKGHGYMRITITGMRTKFGNIAHNLSDVKESPTPLERKLLQLSKVIGFVGIVVSSIIFVLAYYTGHTFMSALLLATSLAVAIVPEALPAVMTVTLSLGVKEMAKRKAIVRKLSAIEALGNVTVIATDKTGTLTMNNMKVKEIWFKHTHHREHKALNIKVKSELQLIQNGILCSTASLVYVHDHGHKTVLGDPTEGALLYLAEDLGINIEDVRKEWQNIHEVPFDAVTKRMSMTVKNENNIYTYTKGAPESILDICSKVEDGKEELEMTQEVKKTIEDMQIQWAKKGFRVLAFSYKHGIHKEEHLQNNGMESEHHRDMIFLGMVAIHDAPRPEAGEAVRRAHEAGIKVVMITGDNERTAESIGTQLGILEENQIILTGAQIEKYSDYDLLKILPNVRIFARTTPLHKSRIVSMYQKTGEIVAVTGDGVNDAIALKQADVGIAMGMSGTDVARETADLVISDDNFATIVNAIEEGRHIVRRIQNVVKYLFACMAAEPLPLIIAFVTGIPLILYPVQVLFANVITDGFPALALAFSPQEDKVMNRPPEKNSVLVSFNDWKYIVVSSTIATVFILSPYLIFGNISISQKQTTAFAMMVLYQSFVFLDMWLNHRSFFKHIHQLVSKIFFLAFIMPIISIYIIVSVPVISSAFKVTVLDSFYFIKLVLMSSLIYVVMRIVKKIFHI